MSDRNEQVPGVDRMRERFERMMLRNVNGLSYFQSPAQPVGSTPSETLIDRGTLRLLHYKPRTDEVYRVPVLIVMATTNRSYIFDLRKGQSYVEYLLNAGYDVFMIDWQPPLEHERTVGLDTYVFDFLPACTDRIARETGEKDVSIIGYCLGGAITLTWAALNPDGPLKNLLLFTPPFDMRELKSFHLWSDQRYFDVDRVVETYGNCPPDMIYAAFDLMRPAERVAGNIRLADNMWDEKYVESYRLFDRWANDILPLAGRTFADMIRGFMWQNGLYEGTLEVGGRIADVGRITAPLFLATAEHDSVIPSDSSRPLMDAIGSTDKHHLHLKGGHVSLVAGPRAADRLWPASDKWLRERST